MEPGSAQRLVLPTGMFLTTTQFQGPPPLGSSGSTVMWGDGRGAGEGTFTERLYFQETRAQNKKAWPENGRGRGKTWDGREDGLRECEEKPTRGRAGMADP